MPVRATDEIVYVYREYDKDNIGDAIIGSIQQSLRDSASLHDPKVVEVEYDQHGWDFCRDEDLPATAPIRITVAGS